MARMSVCPSVTRRYCVVTAELIELVVGIEATLGLLSTHADRQGVDKSVTVCFVYVFVRLQISSPRIKLAVSNFARRFIGVLGRESHILGNFAPQKPKIGRIGHQR